LVSWGHSSRRWGGCKESRDYYVCS
jgi:hypothetical protein